MDHWTLGSQVTMYHYNATSSRLDPAPHAFGMRRTGAQMQKPRHIGATPDDTATPDRRPKPSTADWQREAGSSAGTPQQLPTCIGAPNKMETNTGHSGMELPERSAPSSFDTWLLPTEVTMRLRTITHGTTTDRCQLQHCIATKRRTHARGTGMAEGRSYRPPRP